MKKDKGFTLTEMIVVIAIVSLIFSILLGGSKAYSEKLNLKNQAYNLVLYLRQAQVYALGVRGFKNSSNPTNFDVSYGVSIDPISENKITFFTDENSDGFYESNENHEQYSFSQGIYINKIC